MKVVAKNWTNYNGTWYMPGQEYETEEPVKEIAEPEPVKEPDKEQKVRRSRKPKAE